MKNQITIKPWIINFKVFLCFALIVSSFSLSSQNRLEKEINSEQIKTIAIDGTQVFSILVSTSKTDKISVLSALDGEYQDQFQIVTTQKQDTLKLSLKRLPFTSTADDKRNAHKVIAATLQLEIPKDLNINIKSDIGSVKMKGEFKTISVGLLQGHFEIIGVSRQATINTLDGYITVKTKNANIDAHSNNGKVTVEDFQNTESQWNLRSINGNISVDKLD